MHDLARGCLDIFGIEMPEVQSKRFDILSLVRFMEDHSGRSTGKTHNYLAATGIISVALPLQDTVWLGQESEIGREVFDKYYGEWIEYRTGFRRFVTAKSKIKAKVSHGQSGAMVRFWNGSRARSLSPDPRRDYKKMQTWRFNHGIFNEWTSWPYIHEIPDKIEPIFTDTNMPYRQTRLFREAMERILGAELGRLSNEQLSDRHREQDYVPRDYMEGIEPLPWSDALEVFHRNFTICYGFEYQAAVKHEQLQFNPILTENDLVMFFRNYDEGDPAYFNKLIYDGSAKKPSDDCYWMHKSVAKKIAEGDPLYAQYSIGVDDIPRKWDGIIYDSTIVEKARKSELNEDFRRIWLGEWTEGRAKHPFSWMEVMNSCQPGWLGQSLRSHEGELFAAAIDSAQGTDATFKTREGIKDSRGDDGVIVVMKVGDGTAIHPHELCLVQIAEDIRSGPMAFDVQTVEKRFSNSLGDGCQFYMVDPGGGGKGLVEKLAKSRLEKTDQEGDSEEIKVIPMVPWDHEDPGNAKMNLCIFSLSNEMITAAYVDSRTGKALLQYEDQLNNYLVRLFQEAVRDKIVMLPQYMEREDIRDMYNAGEIDDQGLRILMDMRTALYQLVHLRYKTDRSGRRTKTSHGVFQYVSTGKKDAAWTLLMAFMMCDIIVKLDHVQDSKSGDKEIYPDVE